MFDYVSKREFDLEHDLRVKAEAAAAEARQLAVSAMEMVKSERVAHRQEMADLLDRTLPKPTDPVPGFGVPGNLPLSYEEILKIPAIGGRGLRERNAAAREAKLRDEAVGKESDGATRRATLTPEEQAAVDRQILT